MGRPGSGVRNPPRILCLTRFEAQRPPREAKRPPREARTEDSGRTDRLGSDARQDSGRFVRLARRGLQIRGGWRTPRGGWRKIGRLRGTNAPAIRDAGLADFEEEIRTPSRR